MISFIATFILILALAYLLATAVWFAGLVVGYTAATIWWLVKVLIART